MGHRVLKIFLWIYLIVMSFTSLYIYGVVVNANGDNIEHLHTSWLIWQGNTPYKDFFQHHNPLTWYLSAPLVAALIEDINIVHVFNSIGILMLCLIAYYQSKIILLCGASYIAALFVMAITISSYSLLWSSDYRPDTFMYLFLFMGLYYLFCHIKDKKIFQLVLSFICFFISFMFTQKVLLSLIIPGMAVFYWVYTDKISIKNVLLSSLMPILLMSVFLLYMYYNDALMIYWKANYPFNAHIPEIFYPHETIFPPKEYIEFYIFLPLGGISALYFLGKGNGIEKVLSAMFGLETYLRLFYFSGFLHYTIFWLMLAIMLSVLLLDKFTKYKGLSATLGIIYLLIMLGYNYTQTYKQEAEKQNIMTGYKFAFENTTLCDYVINGYYAVHNLKAKDPGYYSILLGQIDVLGEKVGIAERADLNKLIKTKMPKIISTGIYWDTYWESRGKKIPAHQIDERLIQDYYEYSGVGDLYILKPRFQKHDCRYNGKSWEYVD